MPRNILKPLSLVAVLLALSFKAFAQQAQVPRFEPGPCAIEPPKGERVECGHLVAREDRTSKSERTIRLPIIILKSDDPAPKPDPVLRTLGGPGGSSLRLVGGRRSSPWLRQRDYILFEQRGTKYAQPALECPEVDAERVESARLKLASKAALPREIAAARACYDRLKGQGINLSAYNSAESAADIEDLRRVLRLDKINLYGVSYSARLMLNVMRKFPTGIRSVVLESTLPPEVNYDEVGVDIILRSLEQLFKSCRVDEGCSRAYPQLEEKFYKIVRDLNARPITATAKGARTGRPVEVSLNGDDFATWIVDYLFSNEPSATAEAPFMIELASNGNFDRFRDYAGEKTGTAPYAWGMRYSVWCSEEFPFEDKKKIAAQSTKFPRLMGYKVMALPDVCSVWKVKPAEKVENSPVKSDIPTLVLAAEYDAYTPPEWGQMTNRNLSKSFFAEIPWAGHGPGFSVPCVANMIADFIDDPGRAPSDACPKRTRDQFKFLVKDHP